MAERAAVLAAMLATLGKEYRKELPGKLAQFNEQWARWCGDRDPEALQAARRTVHGLVGSGATFGFPEISAAARALLACLPNDVAGAGQIEFSSDLIARRIGELQAAVAATRQEV